jgi:hypothetical protein
VHWACGSPCFAYSCCMVATPLVVLSLLNTTMGIVTPPGTLFLKITLDRGIGVYFRKPVVNSGLSSAFESGVVQELPLCTMLFTVQTHIGMCVALSAEHTV